MLREANWTGQNIYQNMEVSKLDRSRYFVVNENFEQDLKRIKDDPWMGEITIVPRNDSRLYEL